MSKRHLFRLVGMLALWPVLENALRFWVDATDLFFAARLPEAIRLAAADAIGVVTYLDWFMGMLQMAMAVGATALIARATGARHGGMARAALGQAMVLGLAAGTLSGVAGFVLSFFVGPLFHLSAGAGAMAAVYLRVVAVGMPFSGLLAVGCAALRGAGDTRTPLFLMIAVNAVNMALSACLAGFPLADGSRFGLGFGVGGIAWGSAAGYLLGGVGAVWVVRRRGALLRLHWHRLRPAWEMAWRILRVGGPTALEFGGMLAANFLLLQVVGRLPQAGAFGAHMVTLRVESMCFLPGLGLSAAAATLVGQALGRGDPAGARRAGMMCAGLALALMSLLALPCLLFPAFMTRLLSPIPAHLALCPPCIMCAALAQPLFALQLAFGGALRGAGDTRPQAVFNAAALIFLRIPAAVFLGLFYPAGMPLGLLGVWGAMMFELGLRGCFATWRFWSGRWVGATV